MTQPSRWLPFLSWPRLTSALMRNEALAGLSVALVMIPQSVAYAALAGMPLVTGLYAALLPSVIAVMFGASSRLSVGPTALTCLLVSASLSQHADPGSAAYVQMAVWLALLSGGVQALLGAVRFGWVLNLVSSPVLLAFTQAAALLIIASQVPTMLGFADGSHLVSLQAWDARGGAFGLVALAVLLVARRLVPRWPMVVVIVGAAAGLSAATGYAPGGAVVGNLPDGLPDLVMPAWLGWDKLSVLVLPALVIALVSFLETASSARAECRLERRLWDTSQDLLGQGLAKIASAFCSSFATSTSFSRSAILLNAGARGPWSSVFAALLIVPALLWLLPVLALVPRAVLAAIVVAAVWTLLQPQALLNVWRVDRVEGGCAMATFAITLFSAPAIYWGVLAGVMLGLIQFLHHRLHPRIIELGLHPDGSLRDRHLWKLPPLAPQLFALRMDDELDFASAAAFERCITEHLARHPSTAHVCVMAQPINRIDVSGVEAFVNVRRQLAERGVTLHVSGIKLPVETLLRRAGAFDAGPWFCTYRTDAEALAAFAQLKADSTPQ